MNAADLFYAIGEIDEQLLNDIETVVPKRKSIVWLRFGAVAACAVFMIAATFGVLMSLKSAPPTQGPSSSSGDVSVLSGLIPISEVSTLDTIVYPTNNTPYENIVVDEEQTPTSFTYDELCARSSVILHAQVLGQYYDPYDTVTLSDNTQVYHQLYAKVRVEYVYKFAKGIVGEEILYIKDNGYGVIGADGTIQTAKTIGGGPLMEMGNEVLLFLNLSESNDKADIYTLSVPAVSKLFYDADELYHCSAFYQPQGTADHTACGLRPRALADILIACGLRQKQTISIVPFGADEGSVNEVVYPTSNTCYPNVALQTPYWSKTTYYTYGDLMNGADEVLIVNVLGQYRKKDPLYFYAEDLYAKVQVEISGLKPSSAINDGDIFYIKDNGWGLFDENDMIVDVQTAGGGPLMEKGNRLLVFLKESEETADFPVYELVVESVSKFYYDADGRYHASGLYHCEGNSNAHPAMLADYAPKTLLELQEELGKDYGFGLGITFHPSYIPDYTVIRDGSVCPPNNGPW